MIGLLKGKTEFIDGPYAIVDVGGVGYRVLVTNDILSKIEIGKEIKLFTYTYVRDDTLDLFGFSSIDDLKLFEQLISVSGVGPKTAVSIFSIGNRSSIIDAVIRGDVSFFVTVPRLGKKNAQKIIIELKSKIGSLEELDLSTEADEETKEVLSVLKSFGFSSKEARDAIKNIDKKVNTVEEKVRLALRHLGK